MRSESYPNPFIIALLVILIITALVLAAGCTTTPAMNNLTGMPTQTLVSLTKEKAVPFYKVTIPQPEGIHPDYLKMDSDVYNQGEVVKFSVVNEGSETLACWSIFPSFYLYRQVGTWELLIGPTGTQIDYGYYLKQGESTPVQQLSTTDLTPGHYKIVTECGVSREFEIHASP